MNETPHLIFDAVVYTRSEMIPHVAKRQHADISLRKQAIDLRYVANIINVQAEHLVQSSAALVDQTTDFLLDLTKSAGNVDGNSG